MSTNQRLNFEPGMFGGRHDPQPGLYAATLFAVHINPKTGLSYQLEWLLTDYHEPLYKWHVWQWFPVRNPGLLSQMLWQWKNKTWKSLGEDDQVRLQRFQQWIGTEADVYVDFLDPSSRGLTTVRGVWRLGRGPKNNPSFESEDVDDT